MKKFSLKELFAILIFFLVLCFVFFVVRPLYYSVSENIKQNVCLLEKTVSEKTGLNVSFEKISPSIITNLNVKNIILSDSKDGKTVAQIKRISIKYNFWDFLKGRGLSSIKNILLDGLSVNLDKENSFLKKIIQNQNAKDSLELKTNNDENKNNVENDVWSFLKKIKDVTSFFPFSVNIKNVSFSYSESNNSALIKFNRINTAYTGNEQILQLKTFGNASYKKNNKKFSFAFSINGLIPKDFEESSAVLRITDFTDGNYTFSRLNFLFTVKKRVLTLRTIENSFPVFILSSLDSNSMQFDFSLKTQDFKPAKFVFSKKNAQVIKKIKNLSLSVNFDVSYGFLEKNLSFSSFGKFYIPETLYDGGFDGNYSFTGDKEHIAVNKMELSGKNIDVDYNGSCVFKNLNVSGVLNVNALHLYNGVNVSTEIYFDPLKNGFIAFAPQLMIEEKSFTALEFSAIPVRDSLDFTFELSDYFHTENDLPGTINISGSFIGGSNYVQASISTNGVYLDSAMKTFSYFGKNPGKQSFSFLSNYVFNGELFVSTDFKQFSYNVPYAFVADTKNDGQFLYFSFDGNDSSLNLSRMDFVRSGKLIHSSVVFEKSPDSSDAFFTADINADSIPYHFTGNFMPNSIFVNGDYGITFDLKKNEKGFVRGNIFAEGVPFAFNGSIFTFSLDSDLSYSERDGINVKISRMNASGSGGKYSFNPSLNVIGNISKYGLFLDTLSYSDKFSSLDGSLELLINRNKSFFDSARFSTNLKNPLSSESVNISAELTNPDGLSFSGENLKNSFYINSQIMLNNFGLSRFTPEESENNTLTSTFILSGTMKNLYAGLNIEKLSLMSAGNILNVNGSAFAEEKNLTVEKINVVYNNTSVKDISAHFNLDTFTGNLTAELDTSVAKETVHVPFEFSVSDTVIQEGKVLPSEFVASLSSEKVSGSFFKTEFPLVLTVLHSENETLVSSSKEQGFSGVIQNNGSFNFSVDSEKPLNFNLFGNFEKEKLDVSLKNVNADFGKLFEYINIPRLKFYSGKLKGSLKLRGLKADPEFLGSFSLSNADFTLPKIVSQHVYVPKTLVIFDHNKIKVPETRGYVKKNDNAIFADLTVYFDRWSFSRLESHVWNPKNVYIPGDFEIRLAHFKGDARLDLNLAFEDHYLDVNGDVFLKKLTGSVKTKELALSPPKRTWFPRSDLKLHFGEHVTFIFDPLLRAVLVPDSVFGFKYDMASGDMELDGELAFRSGDISYLSRNFYLKNGSMRFNSNDPTFNPLISIQAETRERDDNGNDVRIILTAVNQYLLNFNAQFSSIPAKSETEIRSLLGQIAVGDSDKVSSLIFATGDYAIQSTIGRSIENKLRDFLNFDILSVRTNVLQNALNYGILEKSEEYENSSFGFGNFFDNSTVYIGKYFGSSLYVDTLMHWSYDKTKVDDKFTAGGLVFRPEVGLEIESPFGFLRWNMAPDINGGRTDRFVSSTSVTLSWKFSF